MSRFSLLHQCHASFPTQAPLQSYFTEYVHFFSSIHHSSKYLFFHFFSSSFQHQLHFFSLPEKQAWLCLFFFFFSPNNYLLFAPASHNECCVKVCTSFFPTIRILLSVMQWLSSSPSTMFPIMLSHHLLLLCPDCSSLTIHFCLSNFTGFGPFDISSPVLQSNHSPFCNRLYQQLLLIYCENI